MADNKIIAHLKLAEVNLELYENRIRIKRSNGVMDIYLGKLESVGFDNKEIWLSVASGQSWKFSRMTASDGQIVGFIDAMGSR